LPDAELRGMLLGAPLATPAGLHLESTRTPNQVWPFVAILVDELVACGVLVVSCASAKPRHIGIVSTVANFFIRTSPRLL